MTVPDITTRLRDPSSAKSWADADSIMAEAADEIKRLRAALKAADADLEKLTGEPHVDGYPLLSGLPKRDPEGRKHQSFGGVL